MLELTILVLMLSVSSISLSLLQNTSSASNQHADFFPPRRAIEREVYEMFTIRQTQMADLATTGAQSILNQQNSDKLVSGTQTAIADNIATQTQIAAATSQ